MSCCIDQNLRFNTKISVSGDLHSSFVFQSPETAQDWINQDFPKLQESYPNIIYQLNFIDELKVGDKCYVYGEGDKVFVIDEIIRYSEHRYGFNLDSGWSEEVAKCYSTNNSV